jgi:hypothetical protein
MPMQEQPQPPSNTDIEARLRQREMDAPAPNVSDPLRFVQKGLMFGAGDVASAGLNAPIDSLVSQFGDNPVSVGKAYDQRLAFERQRMDNYRQRNPLVADTAEAAGAVAPALAATILSGGAAAPMALEASPAAQTGIKRLGQFLSENIAKPAATNAAYGLGYSFGSGRGGFDNRLDAANEGAMVGAITGPLIPAGVNFGKGVYDTVANQFTGRMSGTRADNVPVMKVFEAIQRDNPGLSPQEVIQATRAKLASLGTGASLADVGDNTRALAGAVGRLPGEGKARINDFVTARQEGVRNPVTQVLEGGQFGRVDNLINDLVPENYYQAKDATVEARKKLGAFYEAAKSGGNNIPKATDPNSRSFADILKEEADPSFQAMMSGVNIDDPRQFNSLIQDATLKTPPVAQPVTLNTRIRQLGGIDKNDPNIGDIKAMDVRLFGRQKREITPQGDVKIVNAPKSLDYMREALAEEGWISKKATIAELLDKISNDASGASVYHPKDYQKMIDFENYNNAASGIDTAKQKLAYEYGIENPKEFIKTIETNAKNAQSQFDNLGKQGVGNGVDVNPVLNGLDKEIAVSKGGIKSGLQKVRSYLVNDKGQPETTIDTLHQAKMAIDDLMTGEARSSMGTVSKAKIRDYQDQIVQAIENSPGGQQYQQGRLGTAGQWRISEALDNGRDFLSRGTARSNEDMARLMQNMKPEELDALRTGAAQSLKEIIGNTKRTANVTDKLIDKPALEERVRMVFGDDKTFQQYINTLENEKTFYKTYAEIAKGSPTAGRLAAQEDLMQNVPGMTEVGQFAVNPSIWNALRAGKRVVNDRFHRIAIPEPVRNRMAEILIKGQTAPITDALTQQQIAERNRALLARAIFLGGNQMINDAPPSQGGR